MPFGKHDAKKMGPYKMYPGKHSEINPGNFKGSEVSKYAAMKMHPMKMVDISNVPAGQQKLIKGIISKNPADMHPKMYGKPEAHHAMKYDEKKTLKHHKQ